MALNPGITNGIHSRDQLDAYPHDLLLNSLAELPSFLELSAVAVGQ